MRRNFTKKEKKHRHAKAKRKWRLKNLDKQRDYARSYSLRTSYGITVPEYNILLESQNGLCKICSKLPEARPHETAARLHVDHCHSTGRVRGLLCFNCNNGLGNFKDNPTSLRRAADYLG